MRHTVIRGDFMNDSTWIKDTVFKEPKKVEQDLHIDTLIIGAGLTGLTLAYYLSNTTNDVLVVEADRIGAGASGRNTCKLTAQHGIVYHELIQQQGREIAKKYYTANKEAIDSIEEIVQEHKISCDFQRCNSMIFTQDATKIGDMQDEYQACLELDIPCSYQKDTKYPFEIEAGISFYNQAKFNPMQYMMGLQKVLEERNIMVYENSPIDNIIEHEDGFVAMCNLRRIHARKIVQATQFPFYDKHQFYFARCYPSMSSLASVQTEKTLIDDMLINIDPYLKSYNTISTEQGSYFLIGGNNHKVGQGQSDDHFIHEAQKVFHFDATSSEWSTQDYMTFDKLPYIGRLQQDNEHLFFASGFNKWGNTTSNIAAKLLCAYLLNQPSQYAEMYDPHRMRPFFSASFLKENFNVFKELIMGKLKEPNENYPARGHAHIMNFNHHPYGVYRDVDDELYIVDITCPHLGCTCTFNETDKTWDCPCHGSRYNFKGDIIKGPSTHGLHTLNEGRNTIDPHIL